jgi:fructokinase
MSEASDRPVVVGIGEVLWDLLPSGPRLGGAPANVAAHARALGAEGLVASRVGADEAGADLRAALLAADMPDTWVGTDPVHPTGTARVSFDRGEPRFDIAEDVAWDYLEADARLMDLAARADAICFGTLAQRSPVSRVTIARCLAAANPSCVRVFDVNLRGDVATGPVLEAALRLATVLKLNETELPCVARALGLPEERHAVMGELTRAFDLHIVALTRGAAGCVLAAEGRFAVHGGFSVPVVDTVGAGDAFTAALVVGALRGASPDALAVEANRVAAEACTHPGAWPAFVARP